MTLPPRTAAALALAAALASLAGSAVASRSALPSTRTGIRGLATGVADPIEFAGTDANAAFRRTRSAGSTFARLTVDWRSVAPESRPRRFHPGDPADPAYVWTVFDREVKQALANGLEPLVTLTNAPAWGKRTDGLADPREFALFAKAAATRFDGTYEHLPRVRYWQVWNEPNHSPRPDLKPVVAGWYRELVNRVAAAVHTVDPADDVVAGGCSPFTTSTAVGPLFFMRQLFVAPVHLDVWSHNPYTSGGPTHHANGNDDVSLGDLGEMRALLQREIGAHRAVSARRIRFWVTEFSWDTSPPDPAAVPLALQTRWTAEALYRMWAAGVDTVFWFRIRDEPLRTSFYQSGLYFQSWRAKRTLYAYRYPFVAFAESGRVFVWGRLPGGRAGSVAVEQSTGGAWRTLGTLASDRFGIFSELYATSGDGPLRARIAGSTEASLPFSLQVPPDHFYNPFGS